MTSTLQAPSASVPEARRPIRVVTAASLFDGHDAAINLMRRIIQASGAEVIHLGHNRSAAEIVECAIEEDATAIAVTSYQGGHIEFFKYMHDLLRERGADIPIFGGGGGTILPQEVEELHQYGIARIYTPDEGRSLGLQGMIDDLLRRAVRLRAPLDLDAALATLQARDALQLGRLISLEARSARRESTVTRRGRGRQTPIRRRRSTSRPRTRPPARARARRRRSPCGRACRPGGSRA